MKHLQLHEVTTLEDGSVRVVTDLSPEETKALLTIGMIACFQQGIMLASLADKMGLMPADVADANSEVGDESATSLDDWQAQLDLGERFRAKTEADDE